MFFCAFWSFWLLVGAWAGAWSIEGPDFDVAAALLEKGVDLADLGLSNFTQRSEGSTCTVTCFSLRLLFGTDRVLPPGTSAYNSSAQHYWSNIPAAATPSCIFRPEDAESVGVFVLLARLTDCPFAIKSGGHAAFANASSTSSGITLSLENITDISLSQDRQYAAIGAGNRWIDVYNALSPQNLTVIGGRASDVGVGGLTLGGGISFFSSMYGWACDNVASFEVVTACGDIVIASPTQNQNLFSALRGGGANFGIVTRFNLLTYSLPNGTMWGGTRAYLSDQFPAVTNAFTELSRNTALDPKAGHWLTFTNVAGMNIAAAELWYANADGNNAPIFANYSAIPAISNDTQPRNLSAYSIRVDAPDPYGVRQYFYTMTFKNDYDLHLAGKDIFFANTNLTDVSGSLIVMTYQSISVPQLQRMAKNGGNSLPLSPDSGPLTIALIYCRWDDAKDDAKVYKAASDTFNGIKREAVVRNLDVDYLYMNYASQYQDVVASYGSAHKQRLLEIAEQYDPQGIFQTLTPGGFKLARAPLPSPNYFSF
ncbi:FAD binding domain-containing protein [Myriangium duriaei CBS 260.36]|uniref:FAD binding domain-containing protein n=1 Tax=Myriangium duriaei CBS 260.36 TaxID=1168546 RepID=A0A9P4JAI8_9PEZI|nr:FAD binding domain-containing protein [Myriangium duriaei CBS 260.36]